MMTHDQDMRPTVGPRGFTLVELLMVVVILAATAGLASTAGGSNDQAYLNLGEVQVRDAVERARALAVSNRMGYAVAFDVDDERFAIVDQDGVPADDPLTRGAAIVDFRMPGQPGGLEIVSASFGAAGAAALFDADGLPLLGGTVVLRRGGLTMTLTLDPATGRLSAVTS